MDKTIKDLDIFISDGNYSSKYPRSEEFVDDGIPFIRANNLVDGSVIDEDMYFITPEKHSVLLKGHVKSGDVLITTRGNIGQVAIVPDKHEGSNINAQIVLLRTKEEKLYNRYLLWALQSKSSNDQYLALQTGTALKQLPVGKLEQLRIKVIDIEEQHMVANKLDKVHSLIKRRREELKLLDELIKARFVELFGEYFKDHINEKELDEVCDFIDYRGKTPEKSDEGIPLITAKNVKDNKFFIDPQEFIPEENYDDVMTRGIPRVNDVLFTTEAPLGNVCRIPDVYEKFCVGQRLITMQPHEDVLNSEYLEYALASPEFQDKMWQKSSGSTVKGIRSKLLVLLTIPVPPMAIQEEFKNFLHQVDKSKVVKEMRNK